MQVRRELDAWSKVQGQVERERKANSALKRQVERAEAELEELHQAELMKAQKEQSRRRKKHTYKEENPESDLSLDAMKGVVQASPEVLVPYLTKLKETKHEDRSAAEAHVIE